MYNYEYMYTYTGPTGSRAVVFHQETCDVTFSICIFLTYHMCMCMYSHRGPRVRPTRVRLVFQHWKMVPDPEA